MLRTAFGSDGFSIKYYQKDKIYDLPNSLAWQFAKDGKAKQLHGVTMNYEMECKNRVTGAFKQYIQHNKHLGLEQEQAIEDIELAINKAFVTAENKRAAQSTYGDDFLNCLNANTAGIL